MPEDVSDSATVSVTVKPGKTETTKSFPWLWVAVAASVVAVVIGLVVWLTSKSSLPEFVNGSFEEPVLGTNKLYRQGQDDVSGWTISRGSIDLVVQTFWSASDGKQSIDLDGDSPGAIEQSVSGFTPGERYALKFDSSANRNASTFVKAEVRINGRKMGTITVDQSTKPPNYKPGSITFEASDEEMIFAFKSLNSSKSLRGVVLDNIRLEFADD